MMMLTLIRDDGSKFAMHAHRELLTENKPAVLQKQIRQLSKRHGQFVRLLRKNEQGQEVAFSHHAGYLLGETVRHYFGQVEYLIFCETLPSSNNLLLVIIRHNKIYFDGIIPEHQLKQQLLPLLNETETYQVVVSGNPPLKKKANGNQFSLPSTAVASFETLEYLLLPRLPLIDHFKLLPLSTIVNRDRMTSFLVLSASVVLITLMVFNLVYWLHVTSNNQRNKIAADKSQELYRFYNHALMTPSPNQQLLETLRLIELCYSLPRWQAAEFLYTQNHYELLFHANSTDIALLNTRLNQKGFYFQLKPATAVISTSSLLPNRKKPTTLYLAEQILALLIDQLQKALPDQKMILNPAITHGIIMEAPLTIVLLQVSPQTLILIGTLLKHLPVSINQIKLTLKSGMMSGTINLSVWGK